MNHRNGSQPDTAEKSQQPKIATLGSYMAAIVAARQMIVRGNICPNVSSKCLLLYYCVNANRQGKFFKSAIDISLETGLTPKTIYKWNRLWEQWGLLAIEEHDWRSGKANDYTINLAVLQEVSNRTLTLKTDMKDRAKRKAAIRSQRYRDKKQLESPRTGASHPSATVSDPSVTIHHAQT